MRCMLLVLVAATALAGCSSPRVNVQYYNPPTAEGSPPSPAQGDSEDVANNHPSLFDMPIYHAMPPGEWVPIGEIQIETKRKWSTVEEEARRRACGMKADALVLVSNQTLSTTYYNTGSAYRQGQSVYGSGVSIPINRKLVVFQALQRKTVEASRPQAPTAPTQ